MYSVWLLIIFTLLCSSKTEFISLIKQHFNSCPTFPFPPCAPLTLVSYHQLSTFSFSEIIFLKFHMSDIIHCLSFCVRLIWLSVIWCRSIYFAMMIILKPCVCIFEIYSCTDEYLTWLYVLSIVYSTAFFPLHVFISSLQNRKSIVIINVFP